MITAFQIGNRLAGSTFVAAFLVVAWAAPALALDTILLADGTINGEIRSISRDSVVIMPLGQQETQTVPTEQILAIVLSGEPRQLQRIRDQLSQGNIAMAMRTLETDPIGDRVTDTRVKSEIEYITAYAHARNALEGNGDVEEAGREMREFVDGNPDSWRYYSAVQTLGELYAAVGADEEAVAEFAKLAAAPSQEVQLSGKFAQAQALLSGRNYEDAGKLFDEILATDAASPRSTMASVGKAICQAQAGDSAEGLAAVQKIIDDGDSENAELFAMAYTALGNCHLAQGENQDAMLAFLHVDLLYPSQSRYRAEALYHLSRLWGEAGQGQRALQARQLLLSTYGGSPWARMAEQQ